MTPAVSAMATTVWMLTRARSPFDTLSTCVEFSLARSENSRALRLPTRRMRPTLRTSVRVTVSATDLDRIATFVLMNTNVRKEKRGVFSMTNVVTADTVAPVELFDRILYCVERARAQGKSVRQLGLTIGSAGKVQRWIERGGIAKVNPDDLRVIARETGVSEDWLLSERGPRLREGEEELAPSLLGRS